MCRRGSLGEWDLLKSYVAPIISSWDNPKYIDVWSKLLTDRNVSNSCKSVLHIIELLLITPFTNAKLERVFSRMNRIKTDSRNRLGQERLEIQLRVGEEGVPVQEFEPDRFIQIWYEEKVRRMKGEKP